MERLRKSEIVLTEKNKFQEQENSRLNENCRASQGKIALLKENRLR